MRLPFTLAFALLFIAFGVPSNAQNADGVSERHVTVQEGAPLGVECALGVEERAEWRLDGRSVPADLRPAGERPGAPGRLAARLEAPAARVHHAGVYTCAPRPSQRVVVRVLPRPAGTAAGTAASPSAPAPAPTGAPEPAPDAGAGPGVVLYDVGRLFSLNCSLAPEGGAAIVWKKNDTAVESVWDLSTRYALDKEGSVFRMLLRTSEDDFGNYTCALGGASETWEVRGRPYAKLPHNTNVVENQKLKLTCKVTGKPYPAVTWTFANGSMNGTDVAVALGGRAVLRPSAAGVEGAELVVESARREDAGVYTCHPEGGVAAFTTLRVKDQYAALWPFLGICAEVFVLCAIILVYEKRRTKPELDDSDTDNHDQKKS